MIEDRSAIRDECAQTAFYIASDRVSRFLPSVISTLVFLVQMTAGFWKTLVDVGDTHDETNLISQGINKTPTT